MIRLVILLLLLLFKIGIQINDLFNDLRDGTNLILLLEILSKNTLVRHFSHEIIP